jgi:hypothetical protein
MQSTSSDEASLDAALAKALFDQPEFAKWLLDRTRFRGESAECVFCRSDNPWSIVQLERPNPASGEIEVLAKQCETDVLAVFQTKDGRRLALHIENKLANGRFTPLQSELYRDRLQQWKNRPKLGEYSDATSVLIAPEKFYAKYQTEAQLFDVYVSHEELGERLPAFKHSPPCGE